MGAVQLLKRYAERNKATLPTEPEELRDALLEVAFTTGLKVSASELNLVVGIQTPEKPRKGAKPSAIEKEPDSTPEKS